MDRERAEELLVVADTRLMVEELEMSGPVVAIGGPEDNEIPKDYRARAIIPCNKGYPMQRAGNSIPHGPSAISDTPCKGS